MSELAVQCRTAEEAVTTGRWAKVREHIARVKEEFQPFMDGTETRRIYCAFAMGELEEIVDKMRARRQAQLRSLSE